MSHWREVRIQPEPFDMGHEERHIRSHAPNAGALVMFQGMVREFNPKHKHGHESRPTGQTDLDGATNRYSQQSKHLNAQSQNRQDQKNTIQSLYIEHYPVVTENEILRIIDQAYLRWPLLAVQVIHRVGILHASEAIVLVAICSTHREDAFHSAQFIMDYLKTQAPFWKREDFADGQRCWVAAKDSDARALVNWHTRRTRRTWRTWRTWRILDRLSTPS